MRNFKNKENTLFGFDDDCFDENGKCINEYALKVIQENNLVEITEEEAEIIRNYKTAEQLAEEEKISKLPSSDELEKNKIELVVLDLLTEAGVL